MRPATAKAKGRATETALVEWLRARGMQHVERRRLTGRNDQGDIAGWPGVAVEVKSGARIDLAGWIGELEREQANAKAVTGFVAIRPKGKPAVDDWFAALSLPAMVDLLEAAGFVVRAPGKAEEPTP